MTTIKEEREILEARRSRILSLGDDSQKIFVTARDLKVDSIGTRDELQRLTDVFDGCIERMENKKNKIRRVKKPRRQIPIKPAWVAMVILAIMFISMNDATLPSKTLVLVVGAFAFIASRMFLRAWNEGAQAAPASTKKAKTRENLGSRMLRNIKSNT